MNDILGGIRRNLRACDRLCIGRLLGQCVPLILTGVYYILTAANLRWYLNQMNLTGETDIFLYYWIRQSVINFPIRGAIEVLPLDAWLPVIAQSGPGKSLCLVAPVFWEIALVDFALGGLWWFAITRSPVNFSRLGLVHS